MHTQAKKNKNSNTASSNFIHIRKNPGEKNVVQPKLTIGSPNDIYEKEADAMADKVMRMPIPEPINFSSAKNTVNRACSQCEKDKDLHRKEGSNEAPPFAQAIVHDVLNSGGRSLDADTRSYMESRFNYDFSNVKIHDSDLAAKSASSINALAYTSGNNVVFNSGQYNTNSDSGKRLLAHELTHVVQQNNNSIYRQAVPRQVEETLIPESGRERTRLIGDIDRLIRTQFSLGRSSLDTSHVRFLDTPDFSSRLTGDFLETALVNIFYAGGGEIENIKRSNHIGLAGLSRLREFVKTSIQNNIINYEIFVPPAPIQQHITPGELAARYVGGFTTSSSPISSRRIFIQNEGKIPTLVHEICHFYTHPRFSIFANQEKFKNRTLWGPLLQQVLIEGINEYFTRLVIQQNQQRLGVSANDAYEAEYNQASRLIATTRTEDTINAYFKGDAASIARLEQAIEQNDNVHPDLLVPPFMID